MTLRDRRSEYDSEPFDVDTLAATPL